MALPGIWTDRVKRTLRALLAYHIPSLTDVTAEIVIDQFVNSMNRDAKVANIPPTDHWIWSSSDDKIGGLPAPFYVPASVGTQFPYGLDGRRQGKPPTPPQASAAPAVAVPAAPASTSTLSNTGVCGGCNKKYENCTCSFPRR